jgi:hypothetical protein
LGINVPTLRNKLHENNGSSPKLEMQSRESLMQPLNMGEHVKTGR